VIYDMWNCQPNTSPSVFFLRIALWELFCVIIITKDTNQMWALGKLQWLGYLAQILVPSSF
jgi:hypothetical protein